MKELEGLSSQILNRTKENGQEKLVAKETELNAKIEANRIRLVEFQKNQKELIHSRNEMEYERQKQSLRNEKRNTLLGEKQAILANIYEGAIEKMSNWDTETFQQFAGNILKRFSNKAVTFVTGEKSAEHITSAFKAANPSVTFSDDFMPGKAGFIVSVDGVDYNYFFDQVVEEIQKDFTPKLASLAFKKNE